MSFVLKPLGKRVLSKRELGGGKCQADLARYSGSGSTCHAPASSNKFECARQCHIETGLDLSDKECFVFDPKTWSTIEKNNPHANDADLFLMIELCSLISG